MNEEIRTKLSRCMELLLKDLQFENENGTMGFAMGFEVENTCQCPVIRNEHLQNVFRNKVNRFRILSEEVSIWGLISSNSLWNEIKSKNCDCVQLDTCISSDDGICKTDSVWQFVKLCLQVLLTVHSIIENESCERRRTQSNLQHNPNYLSVKDLKSVSGLLQLVIIYGIWPSLIPGLGKPLSVKIPSEVKPSKEINNAKLFIVSKALLILVTNKEFCTQILPLCTGDILASLLQLGYEPLKDQSGTQFCKHGRYWCRKQAREFISKSYQPLVIKELLILQRCATNSERPNVKWFIRCIGEQLSDCLMAKDGVFNVIQATLDGMPENLQWVHYESVGRVIARVPKNVPSEEEYFVKVITQLFTLLENEPKNEQHLLISIATIIQIFEGDAEIGRKVITQQLTEPLKKFYNTESVAINEQFISCIKALHNLVGTNDTIITERIFLTLGDCALQPLFLLYAIPVDGFSALREAVREVLTSILQSIPDTNFMDNVFLYMFGRPKSQTTSVINKINPTLTFKYFESTSIDVRNYRTFSINDLQTEQRIDAFLHILKSEKLKKRRGDVFVSLMQQMVEDVSTKHIPDTGSEANQLQKERKSDSCLMEIDQNIQDLKFNIELVSTVSAMVDFFGHSVLQDTPQIITFIKGMLDWTQDETLGEFSVTIQGSTVDLVLMLLSALLGSQQLTDADYDVLKTILPSLERTLHCHKNASSRAMANDIATFISTRGSMTHLKNKSPVVTDIDGDDDLLSENGYKKTLQELLDPLIPTRGHALMKLSKLLKLRNPTAVKDETKLFEIFEANLKHEDTYIYLAAVDGLISLVDVHHRKVMPLLCRRFIEMRTKELDTPASHNRMKLCESIIRSCHLCGEMLPMYKDLLLTTFSCGVKDEDYLIRASALSGIGDLCYLLKYSIGSIIEEVFSCVTHVVSTDKSNEVRRAGVSVCSQLLKGLDVGILEAIPHKVKEIYNMMKLIKIIDMDETTKLHADNALGILDSIIKELLTPKPLVTYMKSL